MYFSQKHGYGKITKQLQINSMDKELKNRLWNVLHVCFWSQIVVRDDTYSLLYSSRLNREDPFTKKVDELSYDIWIDFLKERMDQYNRKDWDSFKRDIEFHYFYKFKWYEVYDFLEFI